MNGFDFGLGFLIIKRPSNRRHGPPRLDAEEKPSAEYLLSHATFLWHGYHLRAGVYELIFTKK